MPGSPLTAAAPADLPEGSLTEGLEASWSNWWGSHQLFASVAAAAPELLGGFQHVRSVTTAAGVSVRFELNRPKRFDLTGEGAARLAVTGEHDKLTAVGRAAALIAGEGFKFFWGGSHVPPALGGQRWFHRHGGLVKGAINFLLALALGVGGFIFLPRLLGSGFPAVAILAVGFLLPWLVDAAIPRVEIAFRGRTRLKVVLAALAGSVGASLATKLLSTLAG
jgi:hypothetical protein